MDCTLGIIALCILVQSGFVSGKIIVTAGPDYDQLKVPEDKPGKPLEILTRFMIDGISDIDEPRQTITLMVQVMTQWADKGLTVENTEPNDKEIENAFVRISFDTMLWQPDLDVHESQDIEAIDFDSNTGGELLFKVNGSRVSYRKKVLVTFMCPMSFEEFPFDQHECPFRMSSFSNNMETLVFKMQMRPDHKITSVVQFRAMAFPLRDDQTWFEVGHAKKNSSIAGFNVAFQRNSFAYVVSIFLPSTMFVVISWLSFLVPPDSYPGRLGLLITTFLVLINIFMSIVYRVPMSSGVNYIQTWLLSCIAFVFMALLVYALILYQRRKPNKRTDPDKKSGILSKNPDKSTGRHFLDEISMVLFPVLFAIFAVVFHAIKAKHQIMEDIQ